MRSKESSIPWYGYIAHLFAGAFLCNAVPHFVHGVSGEKFQSPFAKPPGIGLSSPRINVLWGMANVIVGCFPVEAWAAYPRPARPRRYRARRAGDGADAGQSLRQGEGE